MAFRLFVCVRCNRRHSGRRQPFLCGLCAADEWPLVEMPPKPTPKVKPKKKTSKRKKARKRNVHYF